MPLHDWNELAGFEGVHIFWMTDIARYLRGKLPAEYRAIIGASPFVAVDVKGKPDVAVRSVPAASPTNGSDVQAVDEWQPDVEVAVAALPEDTSVLVERSGRLVAAIELISPRNKDRPAARTQYAARYLSYVRNGVHLMLVDVHARPAGFSFAGVIAESLNFVPPPFAAPLAVSYRVGEPAAEGGRMLAVWQRSLVIGQPLPALPLALDGGKTVVVDLETTYQRAAADAYVE